MFLRTASAGTPSSRHRRRLAPAVLVGLIAAVCVAGCGGGGGSSSYGSVFGRSFTLTETGLDFSMSIDASGRFTLYMVSSTAAADGVGAQGSVTTGGSFSAQALSGALQFTGTVSAANKTVTVTVRSGSSTLLDFTANEVAAGASLSTTLAGTYTGTATSDTAYLTVDPTGHATLYGVVNSTTGGGALAVDTNGAITSTGSAVVGTLTGGSSGSLALTTFAGQPVSTTIALTKTTRAKWTFLVFLNAANDLQPYAGLNVNQMEKIGSTADVNIVVQWKQASCSSCGSPTWTGTRRYYITKDSDTSTVTSTIVQNMGTNVDMGSWSVMRDFIQWGQTQYPADHYALVIWNHGAGWRPTRAETGRLAVFPRSVSIDSERDTEIQTWQLPQALNVTPQMDTVIFDASLMQMLEVAYEMKDSTSIITGSEESPPGAGYVYDGFLADLVANPSMSAAELGSAIVTRTFESYGSTGDNTQSVIDTSKLADVASKLDAFGTVLQLNAGSLTTAIRNARSNADSYAYPDNKDLWHYAQLVKAATSISAVQTAATNLQTAIATAVLYEQHGSSHSNSHGIAIYVPSPASYLSSYSNLALARTTSWETWLQNQP